MMKKLTMALLAVLATVLQAQAIDLKITYNAQAVCRYEITIKAGGATIGKGTTDDNGDVSFTGPTGLKDIDVHGYKKSANGEKKFDIQGYVKLDENGFAHIKMETLIKEVSNDAGFPESLMAGAWGLTDLDCGAKVGAKPAKEEDQPNNTSNASVEEPTDDKAALPTQAESLAMQEQGFKNEIAALDRKIEKSKAEIEKLKVAAADERSIRVKELETEEMKLKRERKRVALERNQKMQRGELSASDKTDLNNRENSFSTREDDLKAERKEIEKELKDEKKAAKAESKNTESEEGKESDDQRREEAKVKVEIASVKTQIKLKEASLDRALKKGDSPKAEIAEKETELLALRVRLAELEQKLSEYE